MCGLQMNSTYAFLRSMIHIQPSLGNYPSPCFWKYYVAGAFGLHRFSKRGDYWKMLLFKVLEAQIVQLVKSRKYKFFCEKKLLYLRQNFHILHYIKTKRCNIFFSKKQIHTLPRFRRLWKNGISFGNLDKLPYICCYLFSKVKYVPT